MSPNLPSLLRLGRASLCILCQLRLVLGPTKKWAPVGVGLRVCRPWTTLALDDIDSCLESYHGHGYFLGLSLLQRPQNPYILNPQTVYRTIQERYNALRIPHIWKDFAVML